MKMAKSKRWFIMKVPRLVSPTTISVDRVSEINFKLLKQKTTNKIK